MILKPKKAFIQFHAPFELSYSDGRFSIGFDETEDI